MMQSPVRIGWIGTVLTVLSISLTTGCGKTADSGDYEVILDQPETSSEAACEPTESATRTQQEDQATGPADASQTPQPDAAEPDAAEPDTAEDAKSEADASAEAQLSEQDSAVDAGASEATPATTPTPAAPATSEVNGDNNAESTEAGPEATVEAATAGESKNSPAPAEKKPREVKLLIPEKTFKTEGPEKALRVSFDDIDLLKVLNMDPVTEDAPALMPKWLKKLDGKRIRIRGFMFPPFEETNIRGFTLARDNQICCFGRNPLVYDLVDVFMRKGETTDYIQNRPFDVIGVFHIGDSIIPGELYSLDDAIVVDQ